jgi:hypothetical protein
MDTVQILGTRRLFAVKAKRKTAPDVSDLLKEYWKHELGKTTSGK